MARFVNISEVCTEIFAGGDAPKNNMSAQMTDEFSVPIYSNGEAENGLYGYTNFARVEEPSITVSARGTIGYTAIRNEPFVPIVRLISLTPNSNLVDIRYLYYAVQNYHFDGSGTSIPQLTVPMLKEYSFPLPDMGAQQHIASILDKLTSLISLRRQQLAKLDELVKARFVEMFGDPVTNPKKWKISSLASVTSKIGSGATPKGGKESYQTDGITLIRSMNVHDNCFEYKDLAHISEDQAGQLDNVAVYKNDVFINITGASVARSCIVPNDVLPARVNQHVSIVRCKPNVFHYIFANQQFLNPSYKKMLLDLGESGGATRQAITKQQLENLTVIVPPLLLQEKFAIFAKEVGKQKLTIQQSLDKLEALKKALMQEYFG